MPERRLAAKSMRSPCLAAEQAVIPEQVIGPRSVQHPDVAQHVGREVVESNGAAGCARSEQLGAQAAEPGRRRLASWNSRNFNRLCHHMNLFIAA